MRVSLRLLRTHKPSLHLSPFSPLLLHPLRPLPLSLHHLGPSSPRATNGGGGVPPPLSSPLRREDRSSDAAVARSNHAISRLSRLGRMGDARHLFDRMPHRDVISWTALISGYARCGMLREARLLFDRADARKNVVTWTALLSGYVRWERIKEAEELFEQMPERNVVSWNTMVSGYIECGLIDKAYELFKRMPERNVVSWNMTITAMSQSGRMNEAYELFRSMPERDVISWTSIVAGLVQNGKVDDARDVFDQMPQRNVVSWNAMISGYAQNQRLDEALDLFEKMPERDIPSWNTMITGLIQNGCLNRARNLFNRTDERNVITWTTMISGYVQDGQNELALNLFVEMLRSCVNPNQGTFVSALDAVSNLAALQEGQQIHQIVSKTIFQFNPFIESALMNMYAKCGEIGVAQKVFDMSKHKDLVSWNGIIGAYAHHGNGREALNLFGEMQSNGFKPNDVTYLGLLSACSHSGLVDEGLSIFNLLVKNGSIDVREDHYACLIDLCGRAGRLEEAKNLINGLKIKPSSSCAWGALLSGCNVHGNESIGKLAAEKLMEAEPNNAGTYMLLSSIYASAGKWKEAAKIKLKMKDKGLKKQPGCSWIEVGNKVHVFVVRDKSHSESDLIYSLLQDLHFKMKMDSYAPNAHTRNHMTNDELLMI